jgi:hypothetical protein
LGRARRDKVAEDAADGTGLSLFSAGDGTAQGLIASQASSFWRNAVVIGALVTALPAVAALGGKNTLGCGDGSASAGSVDRTGSA